VDAQEIALINSKLPASNTIFSFLVITNLLVSLSSLDHRGAQFKTRVPQSTGLLILARIR
jgi:hypothetical protein